MQSEQATYGSHRPRGAVAALVGLTRGASAHWLGMRVAYLARSLGLRLLGGRPLDVEALGVRMRLHPAHNNAEKRLAFTPQYFDTAELDYLLAHIPAEVVFIDIGADVGSYALVVAARTGPRARILAIEPQPEIFERLVFNIRQNDFSTVKALAWAVSDEDGPVTLFVDPANSGATSMRMVTGDRHGRQISVEARTLAGIVADERLSRIDAMKVDVEGAEDLVLEPFFRDAPPALWPGILVVEDGLAPSLPEQLAACGYALARRTGTNAIYRRAA